MHYGMSTMWYDPIVSTQCSVREKSGNVQADLSHEGISLRCVLQRKREPSTEHEVLLLL